MFKRMSESCDCVLDDIDKFGGWVCWYKRVFPPTVFFYHVCREPRWFWLWSQCSDRIFYDVRPRCHEPAQIYERTREWKAQTTLMDRHISPWEKNKHNYMSSSLPSLWLLQTFPTQSDLHFLCCCLWQSPGLIACLYVCVSWTQKRSLEVLISLAGGHLGCALLFCSHPCNIYSSHRTQHLPTPLISSFPLLSWGLLPSTK